MTTTTMLLLLGLFNLAGVGDLGLSPAQRTQVRDLSDEARAQQQKTRADIDLVGLELRRELEKDAPDERKVSSIIERMSGLEAQARKGQILTWLKIRGLLTKEQRAKLEVERRAEHDEDFEPMMIDPFDGARRGAAARQLAEQMSALERGRWDLERRHGDLERYQRELARAQAELERAQAEMQRSRAELQHPAPAGGGASTVTVDSRPSARVLIDGRDVGATPLVQPVAPGHHKVGFKVGDKVYTSEVEVPPGGNITLSRSFSE